MLCAEGRIDTAFFSYEPGLLDGLIHNDHLGTPQKMTDDSGAVVWSADYKPFGEVSVTTHTITNNLRFPGQYYDAETELNYNYYRDYNPMIGRYVETDPIGQRGGINLFTYVGNNSVKRLDRFGLFWIFQGWQIDQDRIWSGRYRQLWAICRNNCNGRYQNVSALYQQWGRFPINTPEFEPPDILGLGGTSDGAGAGADFGNAIADLAEAALQSGGGTEDSQFNQIIRGDGQNYCDQLGNTYIRNPPHIRNTFIGNP